MYKNSAFYYRSKNHGFSGTSFGFAILRSGLALIGFSEITTQISLWSIIAYLWL